MMKKITILLMAVLMNLSLFAQLRPEPGNIGMGFRVTGLANLGLFTPESSIMQGYPIPDPHAIFRRPLTIDDLMPQEMIFGKYYLTEQNVLRLGVSAGYFAESFYQEDTVFLPASTSEDRRVNTFSTGLNVGFERHFASAAVRIDPYAGVQLNTAYLHRIFYEEVIDDQGPQPSNTIETIIYPGGWGVGLHLFSGFNYFFTSNMSIGAEMSLGYDMIRFGGDWERTRIDGIQDATLLDERGTYRFIHNRLNVNSTAGINLTVFF